MQGVPDITGGVFPLASSAPPVNMFAPVHQQVPSIPPTSDKPTAAQAAAGRLQRASARQAAKAAQQQKRQAQARAAVAAKRGSTTIKRKKAEVVVEEEDEEDGTKTRPICFIAYTMPPPKPSISSPHFIRASN
jgi:hypothetical protein